jgi:hypothetical protein
MKSRKKGHINLHNFKPHPGQMMAAIIESPLHGGGNGVAII